MLIPNVISEKVEIVNEVISPIQFTVQDISITHETIKDKIEDTVIVKETTINQDGN